MTDRAIVTVGLCVLALVLAGTLTVGDGPAFHAGTVAAGAAMAAGITRAQRSVPARPPPLNRRF